MVALAVEVKKRLIEADPYETGDRALLNLGHTFGHAFELLSDYRLKHGFGVAQGMMVAARLAEDLGLAPEALTTRTAGLLRAYGLPLQWGAALGPEIGPGAGAGGDDHGQEAPRGPPALRARPGHRRCAR